MRRDKRAVWAVSGGLIGVGLVAVLLTISWVMSGLGVVAVALGVAIAARTQSCSTQAVPSGVALSDGGEPPIELIVAIIRPAKLNDVKQGLIEAGVPSLTVTNVSGRGTQPTETGRWRGQEYIVDLHQKVKLEVAVPSEQTDLVVDAMQEAAQTGEPGDGKIFVLPVSTACRVSTNERGLAAM